MFTTLKEHRKPIKEIIIKSPKTQTETRKKNPVNLRFIIKFQGMNIIGIARTNAKNPVYIARDEVQINSDQVKELIGGDISIEINSDIPKVCKINNIRVCLPMTSKSLNFIIDHT